MLAHVVTPGRWRSLVTSSDQNRIFTLLSLDQRSSFLNMLSPNVAHEAVVQIKRELITGLADLASGLSLDADYGQDAASSVPGDCGLMFALEKYGYAGEPNCRRTLLDEAWSVCDIKRSGASAVKLQFYYHPDEGLFTEHLENTLTKVIDLCRAQDISLFLQPALFSTQPGVCKTNAVFAAQRELLLAQTARRLSALEPDVLEFEFPVDPVYETDKRRWHLACEALTRNSQVPWVLMSAGSTKDLFPEQVRIASMSGASGFRVGRLLWKEAVPMSAEARSDYLRTTSRPLLEQLTEIAIKHAQPWMNYYAPQTINRPQRLTMQSPIARLALSASLE
jgi:tagatose-1,6-bisphosphate aldolase